MNQIRLLIRELVTSEAESGRQGSLLRESPSLTQRAVDLGLAICVTGSPESSGHLMVYDPAEVTRSVSKYGERGLDTGDNSPARQYSIVKAGIAWNPGESPCNDAKVVMSAAASKGSGLGPVAYEAAMWLTGGLTSDRYDVSSQAAGVWRKFGSRPDVTADPFDDVSDPKTPPPDDDCELHDTPQLNYSYKLRNKPQGLDTLMSRHERCDEFCRSHGVNGLEFYIFLLYKELFRHRWEDSEIQQLQQDNPYLPRILTPDPDAK